MPEITIEVEEGVLRRFQDWAKCAGVTPEILMKIALEDYVLSLDEQDKQAVVIPSRDQDDEGIVASL